MNDTTITIRGHAGSVPELRKSASGTVWTSFRLASTSRKRSPDGGWEDKATLWVSVTVFRQLAERVAAVVRKGTPLTIVGDLSHEEWVTQDGQPRSGPAVIARSVAIDLTSGSLVWNRTAPSGAGGEESGDGSHGNVPDLTGFEVLADEGTPEPAMAGASASGTAAGEEGDGDGPPF
ncbi:single-stranded DNA-binding protein [Litorihabitans aurantiacus]|uniref:Single-stranded DNA-binding protein n=1 Tax=Litorihabitans aurantiacus TaxID=1930061 RepID=A0AA37XF54_9MICO|nr:single-stranded DNA-binding protein [Litorihabitans aurantiacus]GMA31920.1 hypothetical protein GCM10025875_19120 [Litorihabitans aurantiacus]